MCLLFGVACVCLLFVVCVALLSFDVRCLLLFVGCGGVMCSVVVVRC